MKVYSLCLSVFIFSISFVYGQEKDKSEFHPHHSLGIMISHTQIVNGLQNGKKKWLSLPSWALNYNYKFSPQWGIGLHSDIVVEDFEVTEHLKSGNAKVLERSYPIATAVMASYQAVPNFYILAGAGGEFAHTGNLFLIRIGAEYGYHISKHYELNANITNDLKINAYNSWAIGLGVTRIF